MTRQVNWTMINQYTYMQMHERLYTEGNVLKTFHNC